jgi:hypothetical protein
MQRNRNGTPDAGRGAGDQCGLASEIAANPLHHRPARPHPVTSKNLNSGKRAVKQIRTSFMSDHV